MLATMGQELRHRSSGMISDDSSVDKAWLSLFTTILGFDQQMKLASLLSACQAMGPPYGAVGPLCQQGNTKILTHDFTHRLHMEVFDMEYYPPELTDWWMDDWISRVYGSSRTRQAHRIEVRHGHHYAKHRESVIRVFSVVGHLRKEAASCLMNSIDSIRDLDP